MALFRIAGGPLLRKRAGTAAALRPIMSFASLARVSTFLVLGAFAVGCTQEDVAPTKVKVPTVVDSEDNDQAEETSTTTGSANKGDVAKPVTPATTPATTTPAQAKPAAKPPIVCNSDVDSVTQSYFIALQRKPDEGGLQNYVGQIEQNRLTRLGVLKVILQSPEFIESRAQLGDSEYITSLYRSFFDRDPEPTGLAAWLDNLANGTSRSAAAVAFANSPEFKSNATERAIGCYF